MDATNTHELSGRPGTDPGAEQGEPAHGLHLPSHPLHAAADEVEHLHQIERKGESEWTPWIAIAGLVSFFLAVGLLMYGIVEGVSRLAS